MKIKFSVVPQRQSGTFSRLVHKIATMLQFLIKLISRNILKPINNLGRAIYKRMPKFMHAPLFHGIFVALLIITLGLVYKTWHNNQLYNLDSTESALLSKVSIDKSLIKTTKTAFQYNHQDEIKADKELAQVIAAAKEDSTGKLPYSASLAKKASEGVTFSDNKGEQSMTLLPLFDLGGGDLQDGRVVYPANTTERHSYTFKRNGLKEDIVISKKPKQKMRTFAWKLRIDNSLEARMLPDGGVGIYSVDPILSTNLQASDSKSQNLIALARQKGQKTYLLYVIPRPYITDARGLKNYDDVDFKLVDNILTLTARNLSNQNYPISIDPTITVTSTSDFYQAIGDTSNIDYNTAGQINRGYINSGAVGSSTRQTTAFANTRNGLTSVAYNGFIYVIGGDVSPTYYNDIQFSTINSNGSLSCPSGFTCSTGVFTQQTNAFTTARSNHTSVVFNGYLYIIGGYNGSYQNDIQYCPLNANGSVGTCTQQTSAFTTARSQHASVVYNGYLYIIGGSNGTDQNDIQYCPLNANGSVGTCTQQSGAFTQARRGHGSVAYNGYLYIIGGIFSTSTYQSDIQYCPISVSGSVGTCVQQTGMLVGGNEGIRTDVYNGYLLITGGYNGFGPSVDNSVVSCPINSNGSSGTCFTKSSAFTGGRASHGTATYNGFLYILGGYDDTTSTYYNDAQYIVIGSSNAAPNTVQFPAFVTARSQHSSVVYNGFVYIIGGFGGSYQNDIQYCGIGEFATLICTQQTNAFTTARSGQTSVAYNGFIYIVGGTNGTNQNDIQFSSINSNGSLSCPAGFTCSTGVFTQQTNAFTTARSSHTSVLYNGYLYIIGGNNGGYLNDIQYCPLNANGSVGTCTQQTSAFTTARSQHTSVVYNGYIYIIGGIASGSVAQNDIQFSSINSNGSLSCPAGFTCSTGVFTQQTNAFTTARYGHTSVTNNGYLFIVGGLGGTYQNDLQYCPFNANGSVGNCVQQTSVITTARYNHTSVYYNGYIYVIGGSNGTNRNDIEYMKINANSDGFSSTTQQTNAFTTTRTNHSSVTYNGYLYIIGGYDGGATYYNDIQYCPLNSNGSVGTCTQQTNAFTTARSGQTSVAYNGFIYIVGGTNGTNQNDIQFSSINSNGSLSCPAGFTCSTGVFTQQTNAFTTARSSHTSVVYNGYLYIIGGYSGSYQNDIQYCPINANGSVGTCTRQANAFTTARSQHTSVVYNGYIYISGGSNGSYQNDIQYCPINSNASVGACIRRNNIVVNSLIGHTSVAYNGYIYIIGGADSSFNDLSNIDYCPINSDASVNTCFDTANAFTTARFGHSSIVYNGYVYIVGGVDTNALPFNDIQYFSLKTVANSAHYERTFDTGASGNIINSFTINGTTNCKYTVTYKIAGSNGIYGSATTLLNVYPGVSQTITASSKRYVYMAVTLDDSNCGGQSNITSITLTYNGAPDAPTLVLPSNNATNVSVTPEFRMGSTDDSNDYIQYKIDVCTTSNCSSVLRNIDQTSSQTGWTAQSVNSNTAYTGGAILTQLGIHTYQTPALSPSTQYWWRAYAIDPGGTNQLSSASTIFTFTTQASATPTNVQIRGGINIKGGTTIKP